MCGAALHPPSRDTSVMNSASQTLGRLQRLLSGLSPDEAFPDAWPQGIKALWELAPFLHLDLDMQRTEAFENVLKRVLADLLSQPCGLAQAREIAAAQQSTGLIIKKKPYAIKASHPLGYSIFLQRPAEGFSFQQHLTHKLEVFHILDVQNEGFVFTCSSDQWRAIYSPQELTAWLGGTPNRYFDKFKHTAKPGDVVVMHQVGTVHTVIGCILEEFATASTDMVKRLHDQNDRASIPPIFTLAFANEALRALPDPRKSQRVDPDTHEVRPASTTRIEHAQETLLNDSFVKASVTRISPLRHGPFVGPDGRAVALFVRRGSGILSLTQPSRSRESAEPLIITAGDTVTVHPHFGYSCVAGREGLVIVEHRIDASIALDRVTDASS